jgi:hypothetical protein
MQNPINELISRQLEIFNELAESAWCSLISDLNTDENPDYRRGFRAGRLCAILEIKAEIAAEQINKQ